jgi:hypothetical protein
MHAARTRRRGARRRHEPRFEEKKGPVTRAEWQ